MNLNKQTATYIFIFIFIIITFIHLYKINNNNNNNKEKFIDLNESQNLQGHDVFIDSMSQVKFINENNNRESLQTIIDNKVNDAMPELSIISYAGSIIPNDWQLCNGELLKYLNNNPVDNSDIRTSNFIASNGYRKTPDLRGRFILGSGEGDGLIQRDIHTNGGEETHTLTIAEMPSHNHGDDNFSAGAIGANECTYSGEYIGGLVPTPPLPALATTNWHLSCSKRHQHQYEGNDASHNNMPPYYVLTYIIKKPSPP